MQLTGALLVDKPSGPTSHDIVAFARRLLQTSRIGHTGTLDPLATGLLVLLVGPATRLAQFLTGDEKEYIADVRLGISTPTYDAASLSDARHPTSDVRLPTEAELDATLERFRGTFLQTPPAYSAKKVAGVAAYEKARRNQAVDLKPVSVTVRELQVLPASDVGPRTSGFGPRTSDLGPRTSNLGPRTSGVGRRTSDVGLLRLRVVATAGFYVRSLAHDLGQALGCGAHLEALRRTRAGRFGVEDAATLDVLQAAGPAALDRLVTPNVLLSDFPAVTLTPDGLRRATNGNPLAPSHLENGDSPRFLDPETGTGPVFRVTETGTGPVFRVLDADGGVLAIAEQRADGLLHPVVVLR